MAGIFKKLMYSSKSVREKNSLRNILRLFQSLYDIENFKKDGQPQFVQVNADLGDGKLYKITGAKYDYMSQSIRVFIDTEHPLTYPEFWPHKINPKENEQK